MSYREVNPEIIAALKSRGFTSCEMTLLEPDHPTQAKVEIIPGKESGFREGVISLKTKEIFEYIDEPSPIAKYVIDESYLADTGI